MLWTSYSHILSFFACSSKPAETATLCAPPPEPKNSDSDQSKPSHHKRPHKKVPYTKNPETSDIEIPMERGVQEGCVAIMNYQPAYGTLTAEEIARFREDMRLAALLPLPTGDDIDYLSLPEPIEHKIWAQPEAYVLDQDNEGKKIWRNKILNSVEYTRPRDAPDQDDDSVPLRRLAGWKHIDAGVIYV